MVVMTLALTTVMVWTGTGTSDALVGNIVKRVAVPASRFVAKNAIRIGEAAQNAQKTVLEKAVKVGYQTALWSYNTWRDITEDETVDGIPMPAPIKEAVESPTEGLSPTRAGQWCTMTLSSVNWTSSTASLVMTPTRHAFPPSFSDSNYNSGCVNGWRNYFKADLRCVKTSGAAYTRFNSTITTMQGNFGNACQIANQADTIGASLQSVFVYPNPENMQYISALSPWELVNPEFKEIVYNQSTVKGTKKCVSEANPLDVQMVTRTAAGTSDFPLVPCPPGYYPEWVEYESQIGGNGAVRKLGRIELNPGQYPQCEMGTCTLKVSVDGETCVVGLEKCYDWLHTNPPSRLKCEYGPYSVGLDECEALEFAYRTQSGLTVDPTEQLQPGRLVPGTPTGAPSETIGPGTAPGPDPHPNPGGNPNPNPGGNTGGGLPSSGSNPNPGGAAVKDPETLQNCLKGAWSWNPIDWVYIPVKCTLVWAFIPKEQALKDGTTKVQTAIDQSDMKKLADQVPAIWQQVPTGGACGGPALTMPPILGGKTYYPLNACEEPMARYAQMSRAVITIVVVTFGAFSCVNSLSVALTGYRLFNKEHDYSKG